MAKNFQGIVVSTKMAKTIVATVTHQYKHPLYKKLLKKTKKYKIHAEESEIKVGDTVEFVECKPISKDKKYKLLKIIKKQARLNI
ncbi:30S ribosomal protein S17 [Candidatus Gottesmanbacteria bacterium]|nr:30S ribosomal protein S17 [Candidatus Gottesmanbacteria bacterium]